MASATGERRRLGHKWCPGALLRCTPCSSSRVPLGFAPAPLASTTSYPGEPLSSPNLDLDGLVHELLLLLVLVGPGYAPPFNYGLGDVIFVLFMISMYWFMCVW